MMLAMVTPLLIALFVITTSAHGESATTKTINLGNKRPEGITKGPGPYFFVSELLYGGVKKVSARTNDVIQRVDSFGYLERPAVGLWYDSGAIWVAGGGAALGSEDIVPAIHVYNDDTGEEILSCPVDGAGFVNDIIVYEGVAYATDSLVNKLYMLDVHDALDGVCTIGEILLPEDPFLPTEGELTNNGIVVYRNGFILGTFSGDGIYYHDLQKSETYRIVSGVDAPLIDGLDRRGNILYGAETNTVGVFRLTKKFGGMVSADRIGTISSDTFDSPATIAIYRGSLYLPNARFSTLGFPADTVGEDDLTTFTETFNVSVVPRMRWS